MINDDTALSKMISCALRHAPEEFGLILKPGGWAVVADLLVGLRQRATWAQVTEQDIARVVSRPGKQCFELKAGHIRALYGHSVKVELQKEPIQPPRLLYHGTSPHSIKLIRRQGLKPMGRQHIHLSQDIETAIQVGKRKSARPVIFTIYAAQAYQQGISFYLGNGTTWLADHIPPQFISEEESPEP